MFCWTNSILYLDNVREGPEVYRLSGELGIVRVKRSAPDTPSVGQDAE